MALRVLGDDPLPERPITQEVMVRGLDDVMWALMVGCWARDPTARPTISEVCSQLPLKPKARPIKVKDGESDDEYDSKSQLSPPPPAKRIKREADERPVGAERGDSDGGLHSQSESLGRRSAKRIKREVE